MIADDCFDFDPLPSSVPTGLLPEDGPLLLPAGYSQELVTSYLELTDHGLPLNLQVWDMVAWATPTEPTADGPGFRGRGNGARQLHPRSSRYIFVPSEVSIGGLVNGCGLFRYDTKTGHFAVLIDSNDSGTRTADPDIFDPLDDAYTRFDPATYTPFDTVSGRRGDHRRASVRGPESLGGKCRRRECALAEQRSGRRARTTALRFR